MSARTAVLGTAHLWLPGYLKMRCASWNMPAAKRVWVTFADHFEPWWHNPDHQTALQRVSRWTRLWPEIADRHRDSLGRPACYTFFYPEEQYDAAAIDEMAKLSARGLGEMEVHLHHDGDTASGFTDRVGTFIERLHHRHGLLHRHHGRIAFGFIHGNWALDNSLPGGRFCGLNNEISLLRDLGCYADFTLPSAPSPAQTRMVGTIYWAKDDPERPKSHDTGTPVTVGGGVLGDLMMIPGPLTVNLREFRARGVPRLECGELAGNCLPTPHRVRLWLRTAPRLGQDIFIKLFGHGAPEKNAIPMLEQGLLERTLRYLTTECQQRGLELYFVSAWQMWRAIERLREGADPIADLAGTPRPQGALTNAGGLS